MFMPCKPRLLFRNGSWWLTVAMRGFDGRMEHSRQGPHPSLRQAYEAAMIYAAHLTSQLAQQSEYMAVN